MKTGSTVIVRSVPESPEAATPFNGNEHSQPTRSAVVSRTGRRIVVLGALVAIALTGAWTGGTLPRWRKEEAVRAAASARSEALPRVTVVPARRADSDSERVLPGAALPLLEASLYARTTGYLKQRSVDIGDRVEEGALLAEIAAPDVDAQLAQAEADLAQSKANLLKAQADAAFAQAEELRYRLLLGKKVVSQEEYDSKEDAFKVTKAIVVASQAQIDVNAAAVERYQVLQGFQRITAPFPGVITARNVDRGDLLAADSPSSREMFHIMRTDVLRVFVNVPQAFAAGIRAGQAVEVFQRDNPTQVFPGKVARTADALDPNTRTLLTEVDVPNSDNVLRPGMYLQVRLVYGRDDTSVLIPAAALVTRSGGPRIAVLNRDNRVSYRTVTLGRDFGSEIVVTSGVATGEKIIVHPGDDLPEGTTVEPVLAKRLRKHRAGGGA